MNGISRFVGSSVCGAALLFAAGQVSAGANLILNPGFETGDLSDWTYSGAGGNAAIFVNSGLNGPSAPGSDSVLLTNFNPSTALSLQQSTGSVLPGVVDYSFDLYPMVSVNGGAFSLHIIAVPSSGMNVDLGPVVYSGRYNSQWHTVSGSVTAPAGVDHLIIEFDCSAAAGSSGDAVFLDNVSITQVPEPTTVTLVGLGLFGAVAFGRKRKS
jgi:hypothetical protein